MNKQEELEKIQEEKDQLYGRLRELSDKEDELKIAEDIQKAAGLVGKYFISKNYTFETHIFHALYSEPNSEYKWETLVVGELLGGTTYKSGGSYVYALSHEKIEIGKFLMEFEEISEEEYLAKKTELFKNFV
jgi:hypothetical protein